MLEGGADDALGATAGEAQAKEQAAHAEAALLDLVGEGCGGGEAGLELGEPCCPVGSVGRRSCSCVREARHCLLVPLGFYDGPASGIHFMDGVEHEEVLHIFVNFELWLYECGKRRFGK